MTKLQNYFSIFLDDRTYLSEDHQESQIFSDVYVFFGLTAEYPAVSADIKDLEIIPVLSGGTELDEGDLITAGIEIPRKLLPEKICPFQTTRLAQNLTGSSTRFTSKSISGTVFILPTSLKYFNIIDKFTFNIH